ncbi:hypothetical protein [Rathayibacter sp. Leaf248]|uniref:hypothetical protein n=1 Tax=Rathayibacter sp. Leaf248 TaxID=2876555 RepID=UPI001E5D7284|nr:hypothetical protein [Rathayibacter sp. Leaf248]
MTDRDGQDPDTSTTGGRVRERGGRERMDPRYDPAFQRGFAGGVDRVRGDDRAFARPGAGPRPTGARSAPLPRIAEVADSRRARREATGSARPEEAVRLPSEARPPARDVEPEAPSAPVIASEPDAPLLRNPWLLVLLLAGLAGTALGFAILSIGYSSPPAPYYGDSDTPSPEWIQRQILYYASISLLGSLPFSLLIAIGVAALRWRGRPAPREEEQAED